MYKMKILVVGWLAVLCLCSAAFAQDAAAGDTGGAAPASAPATDAPAKEPPPKEGPAAADWSTFFPDGLLDAEGNSASVDSLKGKIVGLYFSAHWCPPCRAFSPQLVEFRDANSNDFEVVFISSDKNEEAQFEYMKELKMNWFTLKHRSPAANAIAEKYGIRSIPTLIVLSPSGEVISEQGRADVTNSPTTCLEDWKAKAGGSGK